MRQRIRVAMVVGFVVLASAALAVQAATIDRDARVRGSEAADRYPGNTIVGVHSWNDDGRLVEIAPNGTVVWEFAVDRRARFFGVDPIRAGEPTPIGEAESDDALHLSAFAEIVPAAACPAEFLDYRAAFQGVPDAEEHCVRNRIVLLDRRADAVRWEYAWYDEMIPWHEVHDAIVTDDGQVAIADMGNHRAFVVNAAGDVAWEWHAEDHVGPGTAFYETYGGPEKRHEEDDWTHMNDVDQLENGNLQLSIRNFDTIVEVDAETGEIVDAIGRPGNYALMRHQHNPQRLEAHGTVVVADSGNDRVVEIDVRTEEVIWTYAGPPGDPLQWPRGADRLPNGNTLITDSRNNRVIEINETGSVVWSFSDPDGAVIPLPYVADRLPVDEEADGPPGDALGEHRGEEGGLTGTLRAAETYSWYVLPTWMHLPQLVNALVVLLGLVWLGLECVLYGWRRLRRRTVRGT